MGVAEVERALDALEAAGARGFDAPSCDCVRTLLTRAEQLGGQAQQLLSERARCHVQRLAERFEAARTKTEARLARLEKSSRAEPRARSLLGRGEFVRVRRLLRRASHEPVRFALTSAGERHRIVLAYDEAVAELVAAFALARAIDLVPEHAGPYNPLRIASELLSSMRKVSPIYLTAQLNRLEELASLLDLPELPGDGAKTLPSKKRGALKKGS